MEDVSGSCFEHEVSPLSLWVQLQPQCCLGAALDLEWFLEANAKAKSEELPRYWTQRASRTLLLQLGLDSLFDTNMPGPKEPPGVIHLEGKRALFKHSLLFHLKYILIPSLCS
uniref:Uncharacterized protein n=1 Tax=Sphaerodactylus townsendi TaxID=933632 RepID=A0ACB8FPJ2_9SAUR